MAYNQMGRASYNSNNYYFYPPTNSDEINDAFKIIANELSKKDIIIKELELKVQSLEYKIRQMEKNMYQNDFLMHKNQNQNIPVNNSINGKYYENKQNNNPMNTPISTPSINGLNPKKDVINFLKEVKQKADTKTFIEFTKYIKLLKNDSENKNEILQKIKILFQPKYNDLYEKLELIISNKKY